ncbi:GNAT family N-acetyltransferase [Marinilactibacillus psychrotolerans]|uniref:N-acetyltransferase n=2 Tax=Marinilactibacillus psychrotolerans TaxID=191770 RepID=A0AAV3WRL3_9LACT|nr:GNAT family N-acetyltransferase [Marinilactibacillus psychrotolerans]GEL66422.1 acetyltransferase [Marinilactibacillus psychrotolerans]GEQ35238.1 N-acetyltransferase [Marinilactibacillus psychrotolerans]SDC55967.1 Protein N-acetyltransferase, RimJ/RimL family [Marinilactibacillus psychrotolerans]
MLETERLRLRDYTSEDFEFLYSMTSNEKMMKYIGNGQTRDRKETKATLNKLFAMYKSHPCYGHKLLISKTTEELIGHAGFFPQMIEEEEYIEIGYWIDEKHWHQGYATEIAKALRGFGEQKLQLEEMISLVYVGNTGSANVAEKNGMQILKQVELNGKDVNVYSTRITKD